MFSLIESAMGLPLGALDKRVAPSPPQVRLVIRGGRLEVEQAPPPPVARADVRPPPKRP